MIQDNSHLENVISKLLAPVVTARAVIHYPHFANSFPLAYYYGKLLKNENTSIKLENFIKRENWNTDGVDKDVIKSSNCNIFFDTGNGSQFVKGIDNYGVKKVEFTNYFPRFIFTDFSTRILNFLREKNKLHPDLDKRRDFDDKEFLNEKDGPIKYFSEIITDQLFEKFAIREVLLFTDTREEAEDIRNRYFNRNIVVRILVVDNRRSLNIAEFLNLYPAEYNHQLKIYFFSASYNMYFLKAIHRFIPLQIRESEVSDKFRTSNFIVYNTEDSGIDITLMAGNLREFHQYIFSAAEFNVQELSEVFHAYNDYSRQLEPIKAIENVQEYSQCLRFHTQDEAEKLLNNDTWYRLILPKDDNSKYSLSFSSLLRKCERIYSLLLFHDLAINHDVLSESDGKSDVYWKLLKDESWIDGRYILYLRDYIKSEVALLMTEFIQFTGKDNPIKDAIGASQSKTAILHNLCFEIQKKVLKSRTSFNIKDVLRLEQDGKFELYEYCSKLARKLPRDVNYFNTTNLPISLKAIQEMFSEIIEKVKTYLTGESNTILGETINEKTKRKIQEFGQLTMQGDS